MGRKPNPENQERFEKNCENFLRALYGIQPQKNQAFYYTVEHQGQTFTRAQAIAKEVETYFPNGSRHKQIIVLFYGLDPDNPIPYSQEIIASKFEVSGSSIQIQRKAALEKLSLSSLLEKFYIL